jgi:monomeric sarcosine oxidase
VGFDLNKFDLIILGTGGVGSAALMHAAQLGARTIGIDRFIAPHNRGSSHGQTRIIRQAYFEHPQYVPLLLESYRLWHELEIARGKSLYCETGLLQVGPADGIVVPGVVRAAKEHGLKVDQISESEINARWSVFRVPEGLIGAFEQRAGYLRVEECVAAHLAAAQDAGAEILAPCEVLDWEPGSPIRLRTTVGELTTEKLIVTAGPWASQILGGLNLQLEVRRKGVFWFKARQTFVDSPCYLYELPQGVFYGFPEIGGRMKVAEHSGGIPIENPLLVDPAIEPHEAERVMGFLNQCLPGMADGLAEHQTCLYTMSPDEHFIVDRHPGEPNVIFAAGLSGHGFKFAPVLGKALAAMTLEGGTELPIGFLGLSRFGDLPCGSGG